MKFLKKTLRLNGKGITAAITAIFVVFLASTHVTHAGVFSWIIGSTMTLAGLGSGFVGFIAFAISYLIAAIVGIFIAIEAWLIGVVLSMNAGVLQSTMVQTGFSVSLSLVNLVFVLGIIVIALATILRNQSYGIKSLLWKLVVMAILVNFGLVIMAPILGFGNSLTQYFVNCIDPSSGGCNGAGSGASSFNNFATQFAGSFKPESSMMIFSVATSTLSNVNSVQQQNTSGAFSALGTSLGEMIIPVLGIGFAAINLILIAVILAVFIVLLIIRYVYIAILAILLPFAWASWVFPSFQKHWSSWWNNFIRWTFFPPIVIFFIYLALITMNPGGTAVGQSMNIAQYTSSSNAIWGSISGFLTGTFSPLVQAFLQEIILASLIIGGMIAANSLGIKLAGNVVNGVKAGAKAGTTWAAKRGIRAGLNASSSAMRPKPRIDSRTGNLYTPLTRANRFRGTASAWLQGKADNGALSTKKGLANTVFSAGITGSGLFKGFSGAKKKAEYECGNCGNVVSRTQPPTKPCNDCHVVPMQWTKLETGD
jgi:hypothetical protein